MIGWIASPDGTLFEIEPIFGSENGIRDHLQFRPNIILPERFWGEWGMAFSKGKNIGDHTIWVSLGDSTYPRDLDFYSAKLRRKYKTAQAAVLAYLESNNG